MDAVVSLAAWVSLVWNHSEWDYKRRSYSSSCFGLLIPGLVARCPSDDCKPTVELCGICFHREVLGNINYGYTGRCIGLSEKVLLRGAELAAHIFGGIEDRCDRTGIRLGAWLQGGLVEGVVYFLASGKLRPPRDLCSAVRAFGLKDACKKWDHCKPCPCRFNHL